MKVQQLIVVRMQGLEGLTGKVVWTNGKRAGVKFERPLYGPGCRAYRPGAIGRCAGDVLCTLAGSSPGRIAPGLTANATARLSRANFVARLAAS